MTWNAEKGFFDLYKHSSFKDLTLWKVEDLCEETTKWELLKKLAKNYTEADIKNFGGKRLLSVSKFINDFRVVPDDCIHIARNHW